MWVGIPGRHFCCGEQGPRSQGSSSSVPPLAPPDDNLSGTSGMEVDDRISYLEQRLQLQEDEIQVLKAALADVLRRLSACEENGLGLQRKGPTKGTSPQSSSLQAAQPTPWVLSFQRAPLTSLGSSHLLH
uniref:Uncharacterized protein n=1 Tax=Gopherus agassizii TaxID=38772 RepID=A0A452GR98_9SAUR